MSQLVNEMASDIIAKYEPWRLSFKTNYASPFVERFADTKEWSGNSKIKKKCQASKQIHEPWYIATKQVIWWVNWVTSSSKQQQLFNSTR